MARHGRLVTPPPAARALEGITQSTVTAIAADHGIEVVVGDLARSDVYVADEMFVWHCGGGERGQLRRRP
ncbi:MAG: aminotransferase class IV [Microthrixaceae bacterium]|nr:aminotransferase class IV [Microthrixaceae bacterium]